jgi:hypothetical protein
MALAQTTPAADRIPQADGSGVLDDDWLSANIPRADAVVAITAAWSFSALVTLTGGATINTAGVTITDVDVALGTTTGTKIGTAVGQKLGFWNVTPVVQPAHADQAAAAAITQQALTDSTGGAASTTLAAIAAGAGYLQADMTAVKDALASLAARLAEVKADLAARDVLIAALRTALVNTGIVKGSA